MIKDQADTIFDVVLPAHLRCNLAFAWQFKREAFADIKIRFRQQVATIVGDIGNLPSCTASVILMDEGGKAYPAASGARDPIGFRSCQHQYLGGPLSSKACHPSLGRQPLIRRHMCSQAIGTIELQTLQIA